MKFFSQLKSANRSENRCSRQAVRVKRPNLLSQSDFMEGLEKRQLLAAFSYSGTTVTLDLNVTNQMMTIASTGSTYTFTLSGGATNTWSGTAGSGLSASGATLTASATALTNFNLFNVGDSATGTGVTFGNSGANAYQDNFNITLDGTSNAVLFSGTSSFSGSNNLTILTDSRVELPSASSLTMANGDLSMDINTQSTPRVLNFSGLMVNNATIQTTGSGLTTIVARGGVGSSASALNKGVAVVAGGKISGGTTGTLSITGYGYDNYALTSATQMYGQGVYVSGTNAASAISTITSLGANVSVTGYGANDTNANRALVSANAITNAGVVVGCQTIAIAGTGLITSGGNGTVSVTGYGGSLVDQPVVDTSNSNNFAKPMGVLVSGGNATITSGGAGLVNVTGFGGGSTANSLWGVGVTVYNGNINSGANGSVSVNGTGFLNSNSPHQFGVLLYGTGCITTGAGTGNTTVTGQGGGSGNGSGFNSGVYLYVGGTITAGGSGNVTVTGTGGSAASSYNRGVYLAGNGNTMPIITSNGGDVLVTGYGGNGGASSSYAVGVQIDVNSRITAGGLGDVTVVGYGGNNNGTVGNFNYGVYMTSSGSGQMPSFITTSGGNVTVLGTGGGGNENSTASRPMGCNTGVCIAMGSYISAGGTGNVSVTGQGGGRSPGATGSNNHGVYVGDGNRTSYSVGNMAYSCIMSSGGLVTVNGSGGGGSGTLLSSTSGTNYGVFAEKGGTITSGGNADVTVNGTGGGFGNGSSTGASNYGVYIATAVSLANAPAPYLPTITSGGSGNVTVLGQGGGAGTSSNSCGIVVNTGALVTSGGTGSVTVLGNGGVTNSAGASAVGVSVTGNGGSSVSTITSGGGDVTVVGRGGGLNSANNYGVYLLNSGLITGGGNAAVNVTGYGGNLNGNSSTNSFGVFVSGVNSSTLSRSTITSSNGPVNVTGYGGATNSTVSYASTASGFTGVYVNSGALITTGGDGTLSVIGYGGGLGSGTSSTNYGVLVYLTSNNFAPQIAGGNSTFTVSGTGGGTSGSGTTNHGVMLNAGGQILATGNGTDVTINGTGGGGSSSAASYGIYTSGCSTMGNYTITSNGGDIFLYGTEGNGSGSRGIAACSTTASVIGDATTPGNITIVTNSADLATSAGSAINASTNLTFVPRTTDLAVTLGCTTGSSNGPLILSAAELATLSGATIQIGNSTTGNYTIAGPVTIPTTSNLTLLSNTTGTGIQSTATSGTGITMGAGKTLDVSSLAGVNTAINGTTAQTNYNQLNVVGDLSLAGKSLNLSGSYTPTAGNVFTIANATNLTGTFTGLADGANVTFNGRTLLIDYTSTSVTLTDPAPLITSQPSNSTVTAGSSASFTAAASSVVSTTLQWQVSTNNGSSWSDISGATSATYSFNTLIGDNANQYRAVFTNSFGTATTNAATLTIGIAPVITTASEMTIPVGLNSGMTVIATGSPTPTYSIISGSLPTGVTLDPTSGLFTGTPAAGTAGDWPVTIEATNGIGTPATQVFNLKVTSTITSFTVSKGMAQRSYIRYLDIGMDSGASAQLLKDNPSRIRLTKANLDGVGSTVVPTSSYLGVAGSTLAIDFGTIGLGNSRNTNTADGYYTLGVDLDGNGSYETSLFFFRLFGDINGDSEVTSADQTAVQAAMYLPYDANLDLNGDGKVNTSDLVYVKKAVGRRVRAGLIITS